MLSDGALKVLTAGIANAKAANEIDGKIGYAGYFQVDGLGNITSTVGDFVVTQFGGPGVYLINFPNSFGLNGQIASVDMVTVSGYTPGNPSNPETASALLRGFEVVNNTLEMATAICPIGTGTHTATPPAGFVTFISCQVSYT